MITGRGLGPTGPGCSSAVPRWLEDRSCGGKSWQRGGAAARTGVRGRLSAAAPPRSKRVKVGVSDVTARSRGISLAELLPVRQKTHPFTHHESPMASNSESPPLVDRLEIGACVVHRRRDARPLRLWPSRTVSPEAPIPVLWIERELKTLGRRRQRPAQLRALGAAASFISVVGNDEAGREIERLRGSAGRCRAHVLVQPQRTTTVKTRYIAGNQQLLRADRESAIPLDPHIREDLLRLARELVADHSVVVISDYAKGVLTEGVALEIIRAAREAGARVVVDPKGGDHIRYRGADLVKPNRRELAHATGMAVDTDNEIVAASRALIERCGFDAVLASLGAEGSVLVAADGAVHIQRAEVREVYDVSGAGDTVVAAVAAALAVGVGLTDAARLANVAAGIVVGKIGTAVVYAERADRALSVAGTSTPPTRSCRARMRSISSRAGVATGSKSASPMVASTCCTPVMWHCSDKPRRRAIGSSSG